MNNFFFKKKKKILNILEFDYVFKKPYVIKNLYFILLSRLNLLKYSRIGFCINKRNVKYSNIRNYIKRLIREKFRLYQYQLIPMDFIIIIKNKIIHLNKLNFISILEEFWFFHYHFLID
ncbi:ribonuclease P protein component [Buchnera aphidicola]|uniref:ribonuclease P protein component n=1 Tax=Buchnera aphidicola TaxID=9 RepID=UPI0031B85410